ncbi:3-keto-disaccharide hydrolase, partial [Escherichia coli]|uniref:3-keto-disaccharide hydrolase n=2 Tax=Pseudomonadati TaxID=3379134 RepID=UPI00211801E4
LTDGTEKPLGEWNSMHIECVKNSIKVWLNGVLVNYGYNATAQKGQIALQSEGAEVEFKEVMVTPIKTLSK